MNRRSIDQVSKTETHMATMQDADYYRRREAREREIADIALLPGVAQIHLEMAEKYRVLAEQADVPARRPKLSIA